MTTKTATTATRKYHVLLSRYEPGERWGVAFGSWAKAEVEAERADYREHGHAARDLRMVACAGEQAAIDAIVAKLNAGEG
jgi:hypothetical protein